ncbi:MAG: signal peptidase [Frankiaceae bacterium]|nr:signal peptidase [Frankiaceae bacterium]
MPQRPRRSAIVMLGVVALVALALDVVSKLLVVRDVDPARPIRLLGGLIHIVYTRNPGAAFSIGTGATFIFGLVAVVVIVVIVRSARRIRSLWWSLGLGLLLGGASGNLSDRLFRAPGVMRGHVVDWIQFPHFAIFNLADSAIVGGGILLAVLGLLGIEMDGRRTPKSKA